MSFCPSPWRKSDTGYDKTLTASIAFIFLKSGYRLRQRSPEIQPIYKRHQLALATQQGHSDRNVSLRYRTHITIHPHTRHANCSHRLTALLKERLNCDIALIIDGLFDALHSYDGNDGHAGDHYNARHELAFNCLWLTPWCEVCQTTKATYLLHLDKVITHSM